MLCKHKTIVISVVNCSLVMNILFLRVNLSIDWAKPRHGMALDFRVSIETWSILSLEHKACKRDPSEPKSQEWVC